MEYDGEGDKPQHRHSLHSGQEATRDGNREAKEGGQMDKRES